MPAAAKKAAKQPAAKAVPRASKKITAVTHVPGFEKHVKLLAAQALEVMRTHQHVDEQIKPTALWPLLQLSRYLEHYHTILETYGDTSAGASRRRSKADRQMQFLLDQAETHSENLACVLAEQGGKRGAGAARKRYDAAWKKVRERRGMTIEQYSQLYLA